jgi:hypothetical protein
MHVPSPYCGTTTCIPTTSLSTKTALRRQQGLSTGKVCTSAQLFCMYIIHLFSNMMDRSWITSRSLYCLPILQNWPQMIKTRRELCTRPKTYGFSYEIFIQKQTPDLLRDLRYRNTLSCQITNLVGSTFDDGEAYVQALLSQLTKQETWEAVIKANGHDPASVPCPLKYPDEDVKKQEDALHKWEKDIERKARVIGEVGDYAGWDGAVPPEDHDEVSEKIKNAKERFLDVKSGFPDQREQWARLGRFKMMEVVRTKPCTSTTSSRVNAALQNNHSWLFGTFNASSHGAPH